MLKNNCHCPSGNKPRVICLPMRAAKYIKALLLAGLKTWSRLPFVACAMLPNLAIFIHLKEIPLHVNRMYI